MSSLESTGQHVARRLELITNWLALVALLGIGIVWGPSADDRTRTPATPTVASLHARVDPTRLTPPSARSHQTQSPPAQVPRRG